MGTGVSRHTSSDLKSGGYFQLDNIGSKGFSDMRDIRVIQVGNIVDDTNIGFKNPQRGRVYSIEGIAPAVYCYGGGNLEPKIIVYE
jgi:hypothetical protein